MEVRRFEKTDGRKGLNGGSRREGVSERHRPPLFLILFLFCLLHFPLFIVLPGRGGAYSHGRNPAGGMRGSPPLVLPSVPEVRVLRHTVRETE